MMPGVRELWEDLKAWRRGERRVAPYGVVGRVYERKHGDSAPPSQMTTKSRWKATVKTRVYRAEEDKWHDVQEG